tara:strand:- start:644 stop:2167 length:1524 start_codon:yes stop_codon:yes gene_type:complete
MYGSYAHVEANSTLNDAGNAAVALFRSGSYSLSGSTLVSQIDDGISYAESTGRFTFSTGGKYFISFTGHLRLGSIDTSTSAYFFLKESDGTERYEMNTFVWKDTDPVERSFQTILDIEAGTIILAYLRSASSRTVQLSSAQISFQKIKSDIYASAEVTTNHSASNAAAFNPFDDDITIMARQLSNGITQEMGVGEDGTYTIQTAGKYVVGITNVVQGAATALNLVTYTLFKNGLAYHIFKAARKNTTDPLERTMTYIMDLDVNDELHVTWDGVTGVDPYRGTTFCLFKLDEGVCSQDSYFSTFISGTKSNAMANGVEMYPFRSSSYSTNGFYTASSISNNISYNSATGKFTVNERGYYSALYANRVEINTAATFTIRFQKNGTAFFSGSSTINPAVDPTERSLGTLKYLDAGDEFSITLSASANTYSSSGSMFSFYRVHDVFYYPETTADGLINNDFTIDTYSQGNLSTQYCRNIDQVPFKLGVRGAGTLRGRGTSPSVAKLGDKKS